MDCQRKEKNFDQRILFRCVIEHYVLANAEEKVCNCIVERGQWTGLAWTNFQSGNYPG